MLQINELRDREYRMNSKQTKVCALAQGVSEVKANAEQASLAITKKGKAADKNAAVIG